MDDVEKPFTDVTKTIKRKYKFKTSQNKIYMCGIKRVKIRTNPHKTKNPDTVETHLVVARDGKKKAYSICYVTLRPKT